MKASTTITTLGMILFSMVSCEKSSDLDIENLQLQLETCKPKKGQLAIGTEYGGGLILELDELGKHGLILAKENIGPAPWGCMGVDVLGANMTVFDGGTATKAILSTCDERGIAARLCARYSAVDQYNPNKQYKDWYLPSINEMRLIASNLPYLIELCGKNYATSTQADSEWMGGPTDRSLSFYTISLACASTNDGPKITGTFYMPIRKTSALGIRPMRRF